MRLVRVRTALVGAVVVVVAGCGGDEATSSQPVSQVRQERATATLEGRSGSDLKGTAEFVQSGEEPLVVRVRLQGTTPGLHGLHVHETGDCSAPDAASAGGHFDSGNAPHGGPGTEQSHDGDLGNIEVREDGTGDLATTSDRLTLDEGATSVVGLAVVVHAGPDDLTSQPAGASGDRIGCGVVELATS